MPSADPFTLNRRATLTASLRLEFVMPKNADFGGPEHWRQVTDPLSVALAARDVSTAVRILTEYVPKVWAHILLLCTGFRQQPMLVPALVLAKPEVPPGVIADLCGLYSPTPCEPQEYATALYDTPEVRKALPPEYEHDGYFLVAALRELSTRLGGKVSSSSFNVPVTPLVGSLALGAKISGLAHMVAALARLPVEDRTAGGLVDWLLCCESPAVWDGIVAAMATTGQHSVPIAVWPRISPELAADVLAATDRPWLFDTRFAPPHPQIVEIAKLVLAGSGSVAVRGKALAVLLVAGEQLVDGPETLEPGVIAHAFKPLESGRSIHASPEAPRLFDVLMKAPDEKLNELVPHLGDALAWGFLHGAPASPPETSRRVGLATKCVSRLKSHESTLAEILKAPIWVTDKVARKRLSDALGELPELVILDALETAPWALNHHLARSKHTPAVVRPRAAWWAIHAPGYDPGTADISDDPELLAALFSMLMASHPEGYRTTDEAIKVIVNAAVSHVVRTPPPPDAREFSSTPYTRTVDGIATYAANPKLQDDIYEHAVAKVKEALEAGLRWKELSGKQREDLDQLGIAARRMDDPRLSPIVDDVIAKLGPVSASRADRDHDRYAGYRWGEKEPRVGHRVIWAMRILAAERIPVQRA